MCSPSEGLLCLLPITPLSGDCKPNRRGTRKPQPPYAPRLFPLHLQAAFISTGDNLVPLPAIWTFWTFLAFSLGLRNASHLCALSGQSTPAPLSSSRAHSQGPACLPRRYVGQGGGRPPRAGRPRKSAGLALPCRGRPLGELLKRGSEQTAGFRWLSLGMALSDALTVRMARARKGSALPGGSRLLRPVCSPLGLTDGFHLP